MTARRRVNGSRKGALIANKAKEGAFQPIAHTTCVFCDGGCPIGVEKGNDGSIRVKPFNPDKPAICSKALMWEEYQNHPQRVTHPLKNIGTREAPVFERISWDDALDEIAERLSGLIEEYGPETLAVSEMPVNLGFGGVTRRFMNYLGTPNYFTPVLLCMGNTAQVHRAVYGWYTAANWDAADLVVYFGQDRGPEQWPVEYLNLKAVLDRGGALIEVDPRVTKTAKLAAEHLRINYGTDAALLLAWINVIIEEGLYDGAFVKESTVGFEELAEHVRPLTPAWAAEICGVDEDAIRRTARMYARASAPMFPWGVTLDMQMNSTAALHAQCILCAICGNLNKSEMVYGPGTGATGWSELSDYAVLSPGQRAKQLGMDAHPLMSFKCMELYDEVYANAGYDYTADIMASSCVAHPPAVFRAMRGEGHGRGHAEPRPAGGVRPLAHADGPAGALRAPERRLDGTRLPGPGVRRSARRQAQPGVFHGARRVQELVFRREGPGGPARHRRGLPLGGLP